MLVWNRFEGFTMVELSLSLVFISTLSLTVVMVVAGAISSYHKSITLNQVNTLGTNLVDDMRMAVQQSPARKLRNMCDTIYAGGNGDENCKNDQAKKFALVTHTASVKVKSSGMEIGKNIPVFGAFCTGAYSYIWNSGYFFNSDYEVGASRASLKYNGSTDNIEVGNFKLLKVKDEERAVCIAAVRVRGNVVKSIYADDAIPSLFNTTLPGLINDSEVFRIDEEPVDLISGGDEGMALYDLATTISEQTGVAKNMYYYTSFILGTVQGGINVNASGDFCEVPEGYNGMVENFDYCALNKFNFAALANGG